MRFNDDAACNARDRRPSTGFSSSIVSDEDWTEHSEVKQARDMSGFGELFKTLRRNLARGLVEEQSPTSPWPQPTLSASHYLSSLFARTSSLHDSRHMHMHEFAGDFPSWRTLHSATMRRQATADRVTHGIISKRKVHRLFII